MDSKQRQIPPFRDWTKEKQSGAVFSAAAVLPVLLTSVFLLILRTAGIANQEGITEKDWYLYCGFLLPQIGFLGLSVFYFCKTKTPIFQIARKTRPKYFLLAIAVQFALFSLSFLNGLFLKFLERFGYTGGVTVPSLDGWGFFGVLLVVAVLPAVLEELVFRGLLLRGTESFGKWQAALVTGALFALYHQNPVQTIYQFFCGVAFALVAIEAKSILPTVLAHFLNNAAILLLQKFTGGNLPNYLQIPLIVLSALCFVGCLIYFLRSKKEEKHPADKKGFFASASVGIVLCALMWLLSLLSGFGG